MLCLANISRWKSHATIAKPDIATPQDTLETNLIAGSPLQGLILEGLSRVKGNFQARF
jgi:hypothetical protein